MRDGDDDGVVASLRDDEIGDGGVVQVGAVLLDAVRFKPGAEVANICLRSLTALYVCE
jgi:hypothetical protein